MEGKSSNLDRLENDAFFYDVRSHTGHTVFGNPFVTKYLFSKKNKSIDYYYFTISITITIMIPHQAFWI